MAIPEEILYDRMKTVWLGTDERGEIVWHPVFLDFARYWGFTPRLCRPYRAQTKGKIESGVKYVRRNFVCGLLGREPSVPDGLQRRVAAMGVGSRQPAGARNHAGTGVSALGHGSVQHAVGERPAAVSLQSTMSCARWRGMLT